MARTPGKLLDTEALLTRALRGEFDEALARQLYELGPEAVTLALLALARRLADLDRMNAHLPTGGVMPSGGITPTTPSGMIPPYAKPAARDCQRNDKQWARAKGFDTFCPLGPWIVTADALDPDACAIRSRLNGELMQNANTRNMIHHCRTLVSYLSHQFTLLPGTLILTGTPEGVGMARTPPVFLKDGDRIEIEVEGIGVLANPVSNPVSNPAAGP